MIFIGLIYSFFLFFFFFGFDENIFYLFLFCILFVPNFLIFLFRINRESFSLIIFSNIIKEAETFFFLSFYQTIVFTIETIFCYKFKNLNFHFISFPVVIFYWFYLNVVYIFLKSLKMLLNSNFNFLYFKKYMTESVDLYQKTFAIIMFNCVQPLE